MTNEHPITPPPELIKKWWRDSCGTFDWFELSVTQASRWGADQELDACEEWIAVQLNCTSQEHLVPYLRAARRPKPPSLKAGAIEVLDDLDGLFELPAGHYNTILRALEQLDDTV